MEISGYIFIGLIAIVLYTIYRILTKDVSKDTYKEDELNENSVNNFSNFDKKNIKLKSLLEFKNSRIKNVYYSIVNKYEFNLDVIHSVDNAAYFEFEDNKWFSLGWNEELEIYQIGLENPKEENIEYELLNVRSFTRWKKLVGHEIKEVELKYIPTMNIELITDVIFKFENEVVYICSTKEFHSLQEELPFSTNWLAVVFGEKEMNKINRSYTE